MLHHCEEEGEEAPSHGKPAAPGAALEQGALHAQGRLLPSNKKSACMRVSACPNPLAKHT